MAADESANNYITLSFPAEVPALTRKRLIDAHSELLAQLNGPTDEKTKAAARTKMHALRSQIARYGGKVDTVMSDYQSDPTTGEVTGVIGDGPLKPPQPAKSTQSSTGHKFTVPVIPFNPVGGTLSAIGSGIKSVAKAVVGSGVGPEAAAPVTPVAPPATTPAAAPAKAPLPPIAPQTPEEAAALQKLRDEGVKPGAPLPASADASAAPSETPADASAPAADAPLAPSAAALAPPPAPAETPEMTMLRQLIAEPDPPLPNTELSVGQKIAYGFLAGMGRDVGPLVSGQKAEAVQKYLLARQGKEEKINNLTKIVQLQQQESLKVDARAEQMANLAAKRQSVVTSLNAVHADAVPKIASAVAFLNPSGKGPSPLNDPDPALRARAQEIAAQVQGLNGIAAQIDAGFKANPDAVGADQIGVYANAVKALGDNVDKLISDTLKRANESKMPEAITSQIAALTSAGVGAKQALAMINEGVGGPVASRFLNTTVGATIDPSDAEQVGVLDSILERISAEAARGSTGRLAEFETEVFPSIFLKSTLPKGTLIGRLKGLQAWSDAKARMLQGQPGAQTEAERSLAEAAGWVVVAHTAEGYPVWQSPQGLRYTETPEVVH